MAIFSDTILDAHFIDGKRDHIQVYYRNAKEQTITHTVPVTWSHPDFQELIKIYPLETLERRFEASQRKMKEDLIELNKSTMEKKLEAKVQPITDVTEIFEFLEKNRSDIKFLFPFKIKVLSLPEIKKSSQEVKNKIQKANNIYSVMAIVGEVIGE